MPRPGPSPLHENPWFAVRLREGYYTVEPHQDQVGVLVTLGSDVVLVRLFRPVIGHSLLELPAGGAEEGEAPVEAARRELGEETGIWLDLARFQALSPLSVAPDRMPDWPHLFQVDLTEAEFAARQAHDEEIEGVLRLGPAELRAAVLGGDIRSCLTLATLFRHALEQPSPLGGPCD